jgi:endonuclease/exonuclease/phosphatase family metal-dependent hydrolase
MRLSWLAGLPLCGCLSTDVSLSATDGDTSTSGEAEATTADPTSTTPTTTTTTPATDTGGIPVSDCMNDAIRVATFNIRNVGAPGSAEFEALADILYRIDADVACIQEVGDGESSNLAALAEAAGYDFVAEADPSPAIGGEIYNACLGQVPLERVESYSGDKLSPGYANDVGRDILAVRAQPVQGCYVGLFSVHLKSGGEEIDAFRRAVELVRLTQAIDLYRLARDADGLAVLGDFNEQTDDALLGQMLDVPAGLPASYQLGSDIEIPILYDPFGTLAEVGFTRVEATWEDDPTQTNTFQDVSRIDYVFVGQAMATLGEVYNACQDNGVDDDPPGNFMEKRGDPLPCSTTLTASDHLPVVVDLVLP